MESKERYSVDDVVKLMDGTVVIITATTRYGSYIGEVVGDSSQEVEFVVVDIDRQVK